MRKRAVAEEIQQRIRTVLNEPNINVVNVIKSNRLRWGAHIVRMDDNKLPK